MIAIIGRGVFIMRLASMESCLKVAIEGFQFVDKKH